MGGLFYLFMLIILVFLYFINKSLKGDITKNQKDILQKINDLKKDLEDIKNKGLSSIDTNHENELESKIEAITENEPLQSTYLQEDKTKLADHPPFEKKQDFEKSKKEESSDIKDTNEQKISSDYKKKQTSIKASTDYTTKQKIKKSDKKKTTDFEKFIGENLLNKIGIVIFILSMVFLGKYAIDEGWLSNTAKFIGIVVIGIGLLAIAHKLRKKYSTFSSVLAGGGIAALYIAITIGFQLYHLFGHTFAFIILLIITVFTVFISLFYDKQELAVFAILGGFATPLLINTGNANYTALFTYILILDVGMLILSYFKKWKVVYFISNFATIILYASWIMSDFKDKFPIISALVFASAFYLIFFLMNIVNNLKEHTKFHSFEFFTLIANTCLYFLAGFYILNQYVDAYEGLFTIIIAVFNFIFALILFNNKNVDKNLIYLLIGLGLTFVSIAIPVQFNGNKITILWAAEAVLLLWLYYKTEIKLMKIASYIISLIMLISLVITWFDSYIIDFPNKEKLTVILNKVFITSLVVIASISLIIIVLQKNIDAIKSKLILSLFTIALLVTTYFAAMLEINYQIFRFYNSELKIVILSFYNYLYFAVVIYAFQILKRDKFLKVILLLATFGLISYITEILPAYKGIVNLYIQKNLQNNFSTFHFGTSLIVLITSYLIWKNSLIIFVKNKTASNFALWFSTIVSVVVLSFDLDYIILLISKPQNENIVEILRQTHFIGWSILWGVLAFILMIIGIKLRDKTFRIIGLSLFFLTILKMFVSDVWEMSAGGRVAAFASLAVLLLVISFLYQKLKKFIFEDNQIEDISGKNNEHSNL